MPITKDAGKIPPYNDTDILVGDDDNLQQLAERVKSLSLKDKLSLLDNINKQLNINPTYQVETYMTLKVQGANQPPKLV